MWTFLFLTAFVSIGFSFDIGVEFDIGNLGFSDARKSTEEDLVPVNKWGFAIYGSENISDTLSISTGFYLDPILNYVSYTLLTYNQEFLSLGVGPFFGFFNTATSILKPGISTAIRVDLPGALFVSFRSDSTIGGRMVQEGDYLQERSDVAAGFYVKNAICSLNLLTKSYTLRKTTQEIVDSFTEYSFKTDIYSKYAPYTILLSFGYQKLSKSFINVTTRDTVIHSLSSLVLGTKLNIHFTDIITFDVDLESSIYSFGFAGDQLLTITSPGPLGFLFHVSTGIKINLDPLLKGPNIQ